MDQHDLTRLLRFGLQRGVPLAVRDGTLGLASPANTVFRKPSRLHRLQVAGKLVLGLCEANELYHDSVICHYLADFRERLPQWREILFFVRVGSAVAEGVVRTPLGRPDNRQSKMEPDSLPAQVCQRW